MAVEIFDREYLSCRDLASSSTILDVDTEPNQRASDWSSWELLRKVCAIALPSFFGMVIGMASGLVTMCFVSQLKDTKMLAALGLCNVMSSILGFSWIGGFTCAINTMSSQDWGAGSYHAIGTTLQRAFFVTLFIAVVPLALAWLNAVSILESVGQLPEIVKYVGVYTRIRLPGLLFRTICCCVGRTLTSIGNTSIGFITSCVTSVASVGFSAVFIPWLHFEGVAVADVMGDLTAAVVICTLAFRNSDFNICWPGFTRSAFHGWLPFLRLSAPSFVLDASGTWTWTLQGFLAGFLSASALAANGIAPQIVKMQSSIGVSLGIAATTIIGNSLGEGRADQAHRAARLCLCLVPLCLIPTTLLVISLRRPLPLLFTQDVVVVQMTRDLLLIMQVFSIFDQYQATLTGILYGVGKQSIAAPMVIVCYWIYGLPIRLAFAFGCLGIQGFGLRGLWGGMVVAVVLHVFSFGTFVWHIDWTRAAVEVKQRQGVGADDRGLQSQFS